MALRSTLPPMRHLVLAAAICAAAVTSTLAAREPSPLRRTATRPATTRPSAAVAAVTATRPLDALVGRSTHPLLPPQYDISGFFPDMGHQPRPLAATPPGFATLFSQEDWDAYRRWFGNDADDVIRRRSSGYLEVAGRMITAAEAAGDKPGLRRLLLVRAVALSFRHRDGWTHAGKALALYQQAMDVNVPSHVAGLWTLADTLSRYSTTPKPDRIRCSALAAKANIQLSLQLLELGQVEAAQGLIKKAAWHEGWLRSDPHLRGQIAQSRALVNSTAATLEYVREQYNAVITKNDEAAALRLYLYARFVRSTPEAVAELHARRTATAVQNLRAALDAADRDPSNAYAAADTLRNIALDLPDGVIRQRTLFASLQYYRTFIRHPGTEHERVKRTLAQMAIQAVATDGARGWPTIRPFEAPPSTQPATQPGTQPGAQM